jgi:hypothetical protein
MWEIKVTTFRVEVAQKKDNESVNSADNSPREDVLISSKRPSVPYRMSKQMPTKDTLPSSKIMLSLWWNINIYDKFNSTKILCWNIYIYIYIYIYICDKFNSTNCYMGNGSLNNSCKYVHFGHNTFCYIHNFLNRQNG